MEGSMSLPHVKLTYEDYLQFPDDGKRHELIEGDHYVTPAPKTKHQRISGNLFAALHIFVKQHPYGQIFQALFDVVLSEENIVQPDLVFVSRDRAAIVTEDNVQGSPDLLVEILSETTRKKDEVTKRKLYERFGVQEYWIVDPELETVKQFRLQKERYTRIAELNAAAQDTLKTPLLSTFHLSLHDLFE
jgi:Uma2 family endonuclease